MADEPPVRALAEFAPGAPAGTGGGALVARIRAAGRAGAARAAGLADRTADMAADMAANRARPWIAERSRAAIGGMRQGYMAAETFAVERAAPWAGDRARAAGQATGRFVVGRALPWAAGLARRVRDRLRPSELREDWRGTLLWLHDTVLDREIESLMFAPARQTPPFREHRILRLHRHPSEATRATPASVFAMVMAAIPEAPDGFAFVDLGAGRGRALLMASGGNFEKVIGVEQDAGLHGDCLMNIAQYPRSRMKCRDVECLPGDARTFDPPAQRAVFYLFKSLDTPGLRQAIDRIAASYRASPRRLYIVAVGLDDGSAIAESGLFEPVTPDRKLAARIALTSPYGIAVWRSLA